VACAAGWLDGTYWLIGPGSASLAQGCRCVLPLQAWGLIVAAARLQLVCFASLFFYSELGQISDWSPKGDSVEIEAVFTDRMPFLSPNQQCQSKHRLSYAASSLSLT